MDVKAGYKQTELGLIPEDWEVFSIGELMAFKNGLNKAKRFFGTGTPIVNYMDVLQNPGLTAERVRGKVLVTFEERRNYSAKVGDVFFTRTSETVEEIGMSSVLLQNIDNAVFSGFVLRGRPISDAVQLGFKQYCFRHSSIRKQIISTSSYTTRALTNGRLLSNVLIPIPPTKAEQEAIAEALNDADAYIESLEQLIAKKRDIKQGAMQELLTSKRRLSGFGGDWKIKRISEIARPSSEKNVSGENLPVLTCSKHLGFVDSLGYFKNQVFSKDTSTYKIITRGQIGYPANHVEEGSIGLQNLYEIALVSPIYVVFSVNDQTDSFFLHRVLKLDSYRQKFKTATTSSVDRRGSLRWPAFSEITVSVPPLPEQRAIASIIRDMDAEIDALETKLIKSRQVRQGMMQELLTGRIRLI